MSPDWADKPEAVPYSDLDNPQSLNLYGYVGNNPLSRSDPDGHLTWDQAKTGLDVLGFVPVVGDVANAASGAISLAQGHYGEAALSFAAAVPVVGILSEIGNGAELANDIGKAVHAEKEISAAAHVAEEGEQVAAKVHGNTAGNQPAELYEKYDKNGNFEKHGVSQNASTRYTKAQIDGGEVRVTDRGPRKEMLAKERHLVETNQGPKNKEPWAGKQKQ